MERVMIVVGTRPEAIKLCPLIRELKKRGRWEILVCSTGQHRAMLDSAMEAFGVRPDFDLDVMRTGQTLSSATARILKGMDEILAAEKPSLVMVQGDTTTAFAAALSAFHRRIPIGHVEAGLRTYHMDSPFPEEFHREAISLMASYHFAPTVTAKKNLVKEGRRESSIHITGNTVVDALRITLTEGKPMREIPLPRDARLLLFTAHRRENHGAPIRGMLRAIKRLVETCPDVVAVCPLHHNPEVRAAANEILRNVPRIMMIEPPEIVTFHHLLSHAYLVITDSGGIQEEAVALGIPTLVTRFSTERTEGIRAGVLRLAGTDEEGIFALGQRLLDPKSEEYLLMKKPSAVFGDGKASARIADFLEKNL
ncbi:MAG: UDP-N-acetylglucosamine 2-epimerase (non-hydrolyzing) [Clostridia bacterium]|nr:UDP-N-acetylglucosamine 2-epimerase (non-hydrolyzing) [Clostridia bacterium]